MARGRRLALWVVIPGLAGVACHGNDLADPSGSADGVEPATTLSTVAAPALAFEQMSAGRDHSCGVTSDNRAYCWGENSDGQLGDGTTTDRLRPVAVSGSLRFRQISAGFSSTCGVTTENRAYCWGNNDLGGLGDGTVIRRLRPVRVVGGHRFRQVQTSFLHACGVTQPSNRVYCWGDNDYGQLGIGTNSGPEIGHFGSFSSRPVAVVGTLTFREVSAGYRHTCGVTTGNRVYCWGFNREGQVGDNSGVWRRLKPTQVAGGRSYRQVDADRDHSCAVTTDNRAFCWGNGSGGKLGTGKLGEISSPQAVAGGLRFERVNAAAFHTCGETTSNRAYCWGTNGNGELGDGTNVNRLTPTAVSGGHNFSQVSAGVSHSCGRTPGAVGYCWGRGFAGQLGNGGAASSLTPVAVAGPT